MNRFIRASIFIGAESGIFTPTAHPYLSLNSADIPLLLQISREGDSALKSSRIQNVNWTFVTCWLIYLSIIYPRWLRHTSYFECDLYEISFRC